MVESEKSYWDVGGPVRRVTAKQLLDVGLFVGFFDECLSKCK